MAQLETERNVDLTDKYDLGLIDFDISSWIIGSEFISWLKL